MPDTISPKETRAKATRAKTTGIAAPTRPLPGTAHAPVPPGFRLIPLTSDAARGPLADEALLPLAARGPVACLWQAGQALVVPRTYAARPRFTEVQADFAARGWPIHVRQSGGGVVPQGPGILNLSLAQEFIGRPLDHAEALYRQLCDIIRTALRAFGIESDTRPVAGSFCDGRYNLAVSAPTRKIAGTAQLWRRIPGHPPDHHVGLVHAVILVQCDPQVLTTRANALEIALDSPRRYEAARIASLDRLLPPACRAGFVAALQRHLKQALLASPPLAAQALARSRPHE